MTCRTAARPAAEPAREIEFTGGKVRRDHKAAHRAPRHARVGAAFGAALAALTALGLVSSGLTLALFSGSLAGPPDRFSTGDVTLTATALSPPCPVSGRLPDGSASTCSFTASYTGTVAAYIAADVLIETQRASAGANFLYNPPDPGSLAVTITSSSPSVTYTVPTAVTPCPAGAPAGSVCYELDNELVSTAALAAATVTFVITMAIPVTSATAYQGGSAQIIVTAHAVQSKNNTLACTTTPAAGSPCAPSGSFSWS